MWAFRPDEGSWYGSDGTGVLPQAQEEALASGKGIEDELSELAYEGCIEEGALQEYRILCARVLHWEGAGAEAGGFLSVLCDSQGCVTFLVMGDATGDANSPTRLPAVQPFTSPILSCDLEGPLRTSSPSQPSSQQPSVILCAFGSSSGEVSLWSLEMGQRQQSSSPVRLLQYKAHSFGVNCLAMRAWRAGGEKESDWRVAICSGGDDQALAISVSCLTLLPSSVPQGEGGQTQTQTKLQLHVQVQSSFVVTAAGAAGAAFKGLCFLRTPPSYGGCEGRGGSEREDIVMVTMAADHRVQSWQVDASLVDKNAKLASPFEDSSPFRWRNGLVSSITDPQCMTDGRGEVLVAGEGLETVRVGL